MSNSILNDFEFNFLCKTTECIAFKFHLAAYAYGIISNAVYWILTTISWQTCFIFIFIRCSIFNDTPWHITVFYDKYKKVSKNTFELLFVYCVLEFATFLRKYFIRILISRYFVYCVVHFKDCFFCALMSWSRNKHFLEKRFNLFSKLIK